MEEISQPPGWIQVTRIALQGLIPIILVLTSVRLLLTEAFVRLEYGLPGFPADPFGLSMQDRLRLGPIALDYLLNDSGIEFLANLEFKDGTPLYNARELSHMVDVKLVARAALAVWRTAAIATILLVLALWRLAGPAALGQTLMAGSRLTLILMAVLFLGLVLAFSVLFVGFHRIFFDAGTWVFNYRDTLIRLFPERFWQVAFAAIGIATALQAVALQLLAKLVLLR